MFYVIGSEDQSRVLLHTAPANRTKVMVEQFGISGVPIPCRIKPTYSIWSNISIQLLCSGVPLCHYYTDNVLCRQGCEALSLYSEFQRAKINGSRKRSLYWLGQLGAIYQRVLKIIFIYLQKKHSHSHPIRKYSFHVVAGEKTVLSTTFLQMVAGENKLFMRASAAIFQNVSPSGSRRDWPFGE